MINWWTYPHKHAPVCVCIILTHTLTHTALGGGGIEGGRTVAGTCLKHAPLSLRNLLWEGSALQDGILTTHLRVCGFHVFKE